jgi:hypothetical protein
VINEGLPEEARKPWRRMNISINSDMQNSTLASYHTYRSIFYFCLSEYLNIPYIPCGMRGISTNFLPIQSLQNPSDPLNPNALLTLERLARDRSFRNISPAIQLPVLQITPVFAKVIDILQSFDQPNWKETIRQIRTESAEYRKIFNEFMRACYEAHHVDEIREFIHILSKDNEGGKEITSAVIKIVGLIEMLTAASINPLATLKDLADIVQLRPWEYLQRLTRKRNLSFILNAQSLAALSISLENQCQRIWKRPFSTGERAYLTRMTKLQPGFGSS